jgi:CheY-like chemotaxis protein
MKLIRKKKTSTFENKEVDVSQTLTENLNYKTESNTQHGESQTEIKNEKNATLPSSKPHFSHSSVWKILVVDDEPEIHAMTKLNLRDLVFDNKKVQIFNAMSAEEAKTILAQEPEIAVALLDIVMETDDAGLRLVEYIRYELCNQRIRLIIRTGQPGMAPERYIIDHYDIDDYKDKTELTAQRLYATLRTALKAYRDLIIIDNNRQGLEKILNAAPNLYRIQPMERFLEEVLTQITSFCVVGESCIVAKLNSSNTPQQGTKAEKVDIIFQVGTGKYQNKKATFF